MAGFLLYTSPIRTVEVSRRTVPMMIRRPGVEVRGAMVERHGASINAWKINGQLGFSKKSFEVELREPT